MNNVKNVWMWFTAFLLCTTIASAYMAIDYHSKLGQLQEDYDELITDINALQGDLDVLTIKINMKIDYGDGNIVWYNDTRIPLNADLLTATDLITSVEYTMSDFGAFVNKIDDKGGEANMFWLWHYYDEDEGGWQFGPVASDTWILHNGDVVSWVYTGL